MSAPKEKDFGKSEPQVSNVYQYQKPPDLANIDDDESRGGKNPRPLVLEDEAARAKFTKEPEHGREFNFSKHLERKTGRK